MSHRKGKDGIFELHVFYPEEDEKRWEKLYDMWHDYPDEVTMYRRKHSLKTKYWRTPVSTEGDEVVRILDIDGPVKNLTSKENLNSCRFTILWDNGYAEHGAKYKDLLEDFPDLLKHYLQEEHGVGTFE